MPFIPSSDTVKVTMQFLSDAGVIANNVFYVLAGSPEDPSEQLFIGGIFEDWWDSYYKLLTTVNWSLTGIEIRDVSVEAGTSGVLANVIPATGAGSASADNVSACITWRTPFAGRSYRGRTYMLPPSTSNVLENTLVGSYVTSLLSAAGALRTSLVAAGNALMVVSYFHDHAPRDTAVHTNITAAGCTGRVCSQRGRLQ